MSPVDCLELRKKVLLILKGDSRFTVHSSISTTSLVTSGWFLFWPHWFFFLLSKFGGDLQVILVQVWLSSFIHEVFIYLDCSSWFSPWMFLPSSHTFLWCALAKGCYKGPELLWELHTLGRPSQPAEDLQLAWKMKERGIGYKERGNV